MTENILLRSLGYLCLPKRFKDRFGINSKRKERLKIFPEPEVQMTEDNDKLQLIYTWDNKDIGEYLRRVRNNE